MRPHYVQTVTPASEPITYDQACQHLRVDSSDDQAYIEALIPVARQHVEDLTGRCFISSTWQCTADSWHALTDGRCTDRFTLGRSPLLTVSSIKYYDSTTEQLTTMDAADYRVVTATEPGTVQIPDSFPSVMDRPDAIQITFTAGYPNANSIPAPHRHAVKLVVSHLYEQRVPIAFAQAYEIPHTLRALLENSKIGGWS